MEKQFTLLEFNSIINQTQLNFGNNIMIGVDENELYLEVVTNFEPYEANNRLSNLNQWIIQNNLLDINIFLKFIN